MSTFVKECRREWARLGVADALAEEMATELATDLAEAEAEGVSVEELLGSGAFDPRSFAASWAAERGIIPSPSTARTHRRPLVLIAFTALASIAVLFAALALLTGEPRTSLVAVRPNGTHPPSASSGPVGPPGTGRAILLHTSAAAPVEWILLVLATVALGFAVWLWINWTRARPPSLRLSA